MPRTKTDMAFVKAVYAPGIDTVQMERYNRMKYAKMPPPPIELILKIQTESGLSQWDFEFMYGIPANTISLVKGGHRTMPIAYWNIFYDFENLSDVYKDVKKRIKIKLSKIKAVKPKKVSTAIPEANKNILDEFRKQLAG